MLFIGACHEPFSNEDLLFLLATPQHLEIRVPSNEMEGHGLSAAQTSTRVAARFHRDARKTADDLNQFVFSILQTIGRITVEPPSLREENRRIWGPFPSGEGNELLLVVDRIPTSTVARFVTDRTSTAHQFFNYGLIGRPAQGDREWIGLISGSSHPRSDGPGAGRFFVSFENIRQIDQESPSRGAFFVGYDVQPDHTTIEVVADSDPSQIFEADTAYQHSEDADGGGTFVFFQREDLIHLSDQEEVLAIGARWLPSGRGRADVVVAEGDVSTPLIASECWDEQFFRVFLFSTIPDPEFINEGQIEACGPALQDAQFPD